jgi:hypothetical protein
MKLIGNNKGHGFLLIDCIVWGVLFMIILALAFATFYETFEHTTRLSRNANDISRTLQAGERWRADIRAASGALRQMEALNVPELVVPQKGGDVTYAFRNGAVFRRGEPSANWIEFLPGVERSIMQHDDRKNVRSWRWEVELKTGKKKPYMKPLFTFQAVAKVEQKR